MPSKRCRPSSNCWTKENFDERTKTDHLSIYQNWGWPAWNRVDESGTTIKAADRWNENWTREDLAQAIKERGEPSNPKRGLCAPMRADMRHGFNRRDPQW